MSGCYMNVHHYLLLLVSTRAHTQWYMYVLLECIVSHECLGATTKKTPIDNYYLTCGLNQWTKFILICLFFPSTFLPISMSHVPFICVRWRQYIFLFPLNRHTFIVHYFIIIVVRWYAGLSCNLSRIVSTHTTFPSSVNGIRYSVFAYISTYGLCTHVNSLSNWIRVKSSKAYIDKRFPCPFHVSTKENFTIQSSQYKGHGFPVTVACFFFSRMIHMRII